jgi:hypothetical protein
MWNADVDTISQALINTGSWQAGNITKLKNGTRAAITNCITAAKGAAIPGDEFVFYFSGHGGDFLPSAAELNEGGGTDNHILVADAIAGTRDRITDDQLSTLLSGFKKSVTISVILDSCYSHSFSDGADDLRSVTQVDGAAVPAGDHLALSAASSAASPTCGAGFTTRLADGLGKLPSGIFKADANGDGTVTTQEATDYALTIMPSSVPKCDPLTGCDIPDTQFSSFFGLEGCGPLDPVCPILVERVPEPANLGLTALVLTVSGSMLWRKSRRKRQL